MLIFGIFFIISIILLLKPNHAILKINEYFIKRATEELKGEVIFQSYNGNFITGFTFNNFNYIDEKINFSAKNVYINPDLSRLMFNNIVFSEIKINNSYLMIENNVSDSTFNLFEDVFINKNYEITDLNLKNFTIMDKSQLYTVNGGLSLVYGNKIQIKFNNFNIESPQFKNPTLITNGKIRFYEKHIYINDFNILSDYLNGEINMSVDWKNNPLFYLDISLENIEFKTNFDTIKIKQINLYSRNKDNHFNVSFDEVFYNEYKLKNFILDGFLNEKIINGSWSINMLDNSVTGSINHDIYNKTTDLSFVVNNVYYDSIYCKKASFNIHSLNFFKTSEINLTLSEINNNIINIDELSSNIKNKNYFSLDDAKLSINTSGLTASFMLNKLNNDSLYFIGSASYNNYNFLNNYFNGHTNFQIIYIDPENINMNLYSEIDSINIENYKIFNIKDSTNLKVTNNIFSSHSSGITKVIEILEHNMKNITYDIRVDDKSFIFDFFGNDLSVSFIKNRNKFKVSKLWARINREKIVLNPFIIHKENSDLTFNNIKGNICGGTFNLNGNYNQNDIFNMHINSSGIDMRRISNFIYSKEIITGDMIDSQFIIKKNKDQLFEFQSNVNIVNGNIEKVLFDSLNFAIKSKNKKIIISEFILEYNEGYVDGSGWGNYNNLSNYTFNDISLNFNFNNYHIKQISPYLPWKFHLNGLLTGKIDFNKSYNKTTFDGKLSIINPIIDKIKGRKLYGNVSYENNHLFINELTLFTKGGEYKGRGSFPLLSPFYADSNYTTKEIDLAFIGKSNNLQLLSPYINNLDSMRSNEQKDSTFIMSLDINGDINNPIRNGRLSCENAKLYIDQLKHPIVKMHSDIIIKNNILHIKSLFGVSKKNNTNLLSSINKKIKKIFKKNSSEEKNAIWIKGDIDMQSFFKPNLNINVISDDIYLESSYNKFKGHGKLNFNVNGFDTLHINGTFKPNPNDFTITSYNSKTIYSNSHNKNYLININIPFDDGLEIHTDNANIYVDGDVTLFNNEINDFVFSGKINFIDGTYFDERGNYFENITGDLFLSPDANSSHIDIHATTNVSSSIIDVSIFGNPESPQFYFSDPKGMYNQTQLLSLLTFGSADINLSTNFSNIESLLSNYIENKIERNIADMATLDQFQLSSDKNLVTAINSDDEMDIKIILGKKISKKIYLNSKIDFYDFNDNQYAAEYRLSPNTSLVGGINTKEGNNTFHVKYRIKYYY